MTRETPDLLRAIEWLGQAIDRHTDACPSLRRASEGGAETDLDSAFGDVQEAARHVAARTPTPEPAPAVLDRDEAVRLALLFTFQFSNVEAARMLTALTPAAFIRALEQDGWTVAALTATPSEDGEAGTP